jgi:crotonobetainyl-CoA:carnitine CoA-transferase CaiB-like acyl-CoA transferase
MALLDSQVGVLANQAMNFLVSGNPPTRMGNQHPNIVPYRVFPVSDGYIIIACGNDRQWRDICRILGIPHLSKDKKYATNAARIENRHEANALLDELTATYTRDDLLARLEHANVPAGPINNVADVFADPQVIHRAMRQSLPMSGATLPTVRSPIMLDGEGMAGEVASPRLGQHTGEVLGELGFTLAQIRGLEEKGAVA